MHILGSRWNNHWTMSINEPSVICACWWRAIGVGREFLLVMTVFCFLHDCDVKVNGILFSTSCLIKHESIPQGQFSEVGKHLFIILFLFFHVTDLSAVWCSTLSTPPILSLYEMTAAGFVICSPLLLTISQHLPTLRLAKHESLDSEPFSLQWHILPLP